MDLVLHWIQQYGYFGIFSLLVLGIVGLPVPDETLLTFTGYLIFRGHLHPVPAFLAGFLGSVCGITVSYTIGRVTGYWLIEKHGARLHIKMDKVHKVHEWFERLGRFALTFGYYIPGVRHLTAYVAGASELEYPVFALYAYTGAFIWTLSFVTLGYVLGDRWQELSEKVHGVFLIAAGIIAALALAYYFWRKRRRNKVTLSASPTETGARGVRRG